MWERKTAKNITLKASWKKTKLCVIAWIINDLAYVSGERGGSKDALTILRALYAIVDVYLAEDVRCDETMARSVDGSQREKIRGRGYALHHCADKFNRKVLHDNNLKGGRIESGHRGVPNWAVAPASYSTVVRFRRPFLLCGDGVS